MSSAQQATDATLAEDATSALIDTFVALCAAAPAGAYVRHADGASAMVAGGMFASLNILLVTDARVHLDTVSELLDEMTTLGIPHVVQARPAAAERVADLLGARGKAEAERLPLMVLTGPPRLDGPSEALTIRQLAHGQGGQHVRLMAAAFGIAEDLIAAVLTDDVLTMPGARSYVGDVDGLPVATGFGFHTGEHVGVFGMGTLEQHRGRGYGAAVAARVIADGMAAGATRSFLQSSELGFHVYQRLGYRQVESWTMWV